MSHHLTPAPDARETGAADTLPSVLEAALASFRGPALRTLAGSTTTYTELAQRIRGVARGLVALGVGPGDRVAILAGTRAEWTVADLGVQWAAGVAVPIYQTNSPEECEYVLRHSGARVVICEDPAQLAKLDHVGEHCPDLEHRVLMTGEAAGAIGMDELVQRGEGVDDAVVGERVAAVAPGDLATIVYTSGTTGPPKGCMLTHANLVATVAMYRDRLALGPGVSVFMFLPLAHALARVAQYAALCVGGTAVFWRGDPKRIMDDVAAAAPTHFPTVPRVLEKVHTAIVTGVQEQSRVRRAIFAWAIAEGRHARKRELKGGALARRRLALADRLVLGKVRAAFGAGLDVVLTGAAPVSPEILEFFDACGVRVLEGYGLTESCAASTLNVVGEQRFGTVGRPLPGVEVRAADDEELLIRGPHVFPGYYRNDEATRATLRDGWLHTGDLGEVDADGFVRITGRKKDLIITSSGKNISPANIEDLLRATPWVSEAVVVGDNRSYLVALLTIDPDEAPRLAERVGAPSTDLATLSRHPGARAELQTAVDEVNARLARIEQIKRFAILEQDLTQAAGELTPTMKLRRAVVLERFADTVDELYR